MKLSPKGAAKEALDAIPGLPADLRAFLEQHDGGRGKVGKQPLVLWSAEQIATEAQSQEVSLSTPGLLLFGTDGGAEAYGYLARLRQRRYGRIPLIAAGVHEFEALADSFDESVEAIPLDALTRGGPWDLLVNATPLGTREAGPGLPVPASILPKVAHVYDLVYNPPTTPLLEAARRLGKPTTSGLEMLLHQAAQSFELWTGRAPPIEPMRRAAKEALG